MELKTQALDRLMDALSPALSAALDRVIRENTDALEEDFKKRLQAAVRETEASVRETAAAELKRAVAEAIETTRNRISEELERKFAERLAETKNLLQGEASSERFRLQQQLSQWKTFADTPRQLSEASSQKEILARFLHLAQPFAKGLAVYVAKSDGLALWRSRGNAAFPEIISQETTDPETYFRTLVVRGKTVAAVSAVPPFKSEALDFFGGSLEHAIEVFGMKLRTPTPKVAVSEKTVAVPSELSADDQRVHAEARRTARLLVSEIKLYHEQELENGKQNNDIYQRLQKEIDLGREMYVHRVPSSVLVDHDYFHEELVRILGGNDPSRLGPTYPGPINS
jgi:hypothetical protein